MLDLNGVIDVTVIDEVTNYTNMRLKNPLKFECAEALAMYEQKLLPNEDIFRMCVKKVGHELFEPPTSYIPNEVLRQFENTNVVPVSYSPNTRKITCVYLDELGKDFIRNEQFQYVVLPTTIYYYFEMHMRNFSKHPELNDVPSKVLFQAIVNEAIKLGAADITLSSVGKSASVYYNVRKSIKYSQRLLSETNMEDIKMILCESSPFITNSRKPKYVGCDLNEEYRGRVCINTKYKGYVITIRVLPNAAFDKNLEDCNITRETICHLRNEFMNSKKGIRIIAGGTCSGKNTTSLAALSEMLRRTPQKTVTVEMPVEQELPGVEQINCDTEEEFNDNCNSLLRQNPDLIYIAEINESNAAPVLRVANEGKIVLSTLHANSCSDVFSRLQDLCDLSLDKLVRLLHSVMYQELVRDEVTDKVYPKTRYVYFSEDRKDQLYGKDLGEIILKVKEWEVGDLW